MSTTKPIVFNNSWKIPSIFILLVPFTALSFEVLANSDLDGDNILDQQDNCIEVSNPNQRNTDGDQYGNLCDADFDNSGFVNYDDFDIFLTYFGTNNPHADFDATGFVNYDDFEIFLELFVKQPGPGANNNTSLSLSTTWQLQLQNPINLNYQAELFDIDLFDTSEESIAELKASGKIVICYFSAGSFENWRNDADQFDESVKGLPLDGWPGERWLDIRTENVRNIVTSRIELAKQKGCDGVDPDNVDGYTNNTGFDLTPADQVYFNRFFASEAHNQDLLVGLKNNLEQIINLVNSFDFSVDEQCHEFDECQLLDPFIIAGKPVFNVEYAKRFINNSEEKNELCTHARQAQFQTLILPLQLDGSFRISCNNN